MLLATQLAQTLTSAGIVYEHERALGNPKPYRDLYKSGAVAEGRAGYTAHLRNGSAWALAWLQPPTLVRFDDSDV